MYICDFQDAGVQVVMHTAADSSTDLISSPSATDDRNASTKAAGFVEQADKGPLSEIVHNSSAASLSTSTTDVAVIIGGSSSIYELRSKRSRRLVLLVTAVAALLVPLTGAHSVGCVRDVQQS